MQYDPDDCIDLAPFLASQFPEDRPTIDCWIRTMMPELPSESTEVLDRLAASIHSCFVYGRREERGVQSPRATIQLGRGTCRDFAVLFMEAARTISALPRGL